MKAFRFSPRERAWSFCGEVDFCRPSRYADLARLGGVSRARITQIMNLLNLRTWKQEEILFLDWDSGVAERVVRSEEHRAPPSSSA